MFSVASPFSMFQPHLLTSLTIASGNTIANKLRLTNSPYKSQTTMGIKFLFLLSRQGKVRLNKWYETISQREKAKIMKELTTLILSRRAKMCNILEYKDIKVIYRRYASLFFIVGIDNDDNELLALEVIHRFVEQMDKLYGNVCELDIIFGFNKAYYILDELLLDGSIQESSKKEVLKRVAQQDELESMDEMDGLIQH